MKATTFCAVILWTLIGSTTSVMASGGDPDDHGPGDDLTFTPDQGDWKRPWIWGIGINKYRRIGYVTGSFSGPLLNGEGLPISASCGQSVSVSRGDTTTISGTLVFPGGHSVTASDSHTVSTTIQIDSGDCEECSAYVKFSNVRFRVDEHVAGFVNIDRWKSETEVAPATGRKSVEVTKDCWENLECPDCYDPIVDEPDDEPNSPVTPRPEDDDDDSPPVAITPNGGGLKSNPDMTNNNSSEGSQGLGSGSSGSGDSTDPFAVETRVTSIDMSTIELANGGTVSLPCEMSTSLRTNIIFSIIDPDFAGAIGPVDELHLIGPSGEVYVYDMNSPNPLQGLCPWDINSDGVVDDMDVSVFVDRLASGDLCWLDLNDDGTVDGQDLGEIVSRIGQCF